MIPAWIDRNDLTRLSQYLVACNRNVHNRSYLWALVEGGWVEIGMKVSVVPDEELVAWAMDCLEKRRKTRSVAISRLHRELTKAQQEERAFRAIHDDLRK